MVTKHKSANKDTMKSIGGVIFTMLIIDGVKYMLWTPKDEEREFHPMIKEHSKEIFGQDSIYFDVKHKLKSKAKIGSIPDAYVVCLSKPYTWYIVENELASHRVYEHIVPQISKFISGIENFRSQREVRDVLYDMITRDRIVKARVEKKIYPEEIHHFLTSILLKPPKIAIIINEVTDEVREASKHLKKLGDTKVVEFKTYVREGAESVHAHLFEPLYTVVTPKVTETRRGVHESEITEVNVGDTLERELRGFSFRKYALFTIPTSHRRFFPGYKVNFILETDIGDIQTKVTGGRRADIPKGDRDGGTYIQGGLKKWYEEHPDVTEGTKVRFKCIEPYKKYKLDIV
jgi:hypothetical protein